MQPETSTTPRNNFLFLSTIDGILERLYPILPLKQLKNGGPTQWLYLQKTHNSYELELSSKTTRLSFPQFPLDSVSGTPLLLSGDPLPSTPSDCRPWSVDWRMIQCLSGLRSVLLVLMDSCQETCRHPDDTPDPDYVGSMNLSTSESALEIMSSWSLENFVPMVKYWKDWPLARFLENPLPPCPKLWQDTLNPEDPLFSGPLRVLWTRLSRYPWKRVDSSPFFRTVFGLSQSKRGFAEVPRSFVLEALKKHRTRLSTPPENSESPLPVAEHLRAFSRLLLRNLKIPSLLDSLIAQEASTRASYLYPRSEGGGREEIRDLIRRVAGSSEDDLIRMVEIRPGHVVEERGLTPPTRAQWSSFLETMTAWEGPRELPKARVAEVLEPLKVRLITAMDALRTFVSKPLQEALWGYLRKIPMFRLIAESVSTPLLDDFLTLHHQMFGTQDSFVSGDYSAATDGLDIRASKIILLEILRHLLPEDVPFHNLLSEILLEQMIEYPKWSRLDSIRQSNGQLMGSVLSFPILCIANAYTYFSSLSEDRQHRVLRGITPLKALPVLINGDDILFRAGLDQYSRWLSAIGSVGFVQSVGKNFLHQRFFTVNSLPMEYIPDQRFEVPWDRVKPLLDWADDIVFPPETSRLLSSRIHGFLNVGLLTGQSKLTGREALGTIPLAGWHAQSVLPALHPKQAHGWFLHYHRVNLERQTRFGKVTLNFFAHPLKGGLGLTVPEGIVPRYTEGQRHLAHQLNLASRKPFLGEARDYPLANLLKISAETPDSVPVLGYRPQHVEVYMHPTGSPLPEGVRLLEPLRAVYHTPLSQPPSFSESSQMMVSSRLSDSELRSLTSAYRHEKVLHPVEEMSSFDSHPVSVVHHTVREGRVEPILHPWVPQDALPAYPRPEPEVESTTPEPEASLSPEPFVPDETTQTWEYQARPYKDELKEKLKRYDDAQRFRQFLDQPLETLSEFEDRSRFQAKKEKFYQRKRVEERALQLLEKQKAGRETRARIRSNAAFQADFTDRPLTSKQERLRSEHIHGVNTPVIERDLDYFRRQAYNEIVVHEDSDEEGGSVES